MMVGRKPKSGPLPEKNPVKMQRAPAWMSKFAKAEWNRVMPVLTERKILTDADLGGLENYCTAIGTIREAEKHLQEHGHVIITADGKMQKNPSVSVQGEAMTRARLLGAELGLTPVSRSRPSIRADEDDDDLSSLD